MKENHVRLSFDFLVHVFSNDRGEEAIYGVDFIPISLLLEGLFFVGDTCSRSIPYTNLSFLV